MSNGGGRRANGQRSVATGCECDATTSSNHQAADFDCCNVLHLTRTGGFHYGQSEAKGETLLISMAEGLEWGVVSVRGEKPNPAIDTAHCKMWESFWQ